MNEDLLKQYQSQLHWHLPEETQQQAVTWLTENMPRGELVRIFTPFDKACLQNGVKVVEAIGYPANKAALPSLVELFQDINWPGALEVIDYFKTLEKSIVIPYIEAGGQQAMDDQDDQWLWFLYDVCDRLNIERHDFQNASIFDEMKRIYERDV